MSETKHTPGPWTSRSFNASGSIDVDAGAHKMGRVYVRMSIDGAACTDDDIAEAEANARLFAAAPDLLAQLKSVLACIESRGECVGNMQAIRSAIVRAEG